MEPLAYPLVRALDTGIVYAHIINSVAHVETELSVEVLA